MTGVVHPTLRPWIEIALQLSDVAAVAATRAAAGLRVRRRGYLTRRPGSDTPMWNVFAALLLAELRPRGAKARLARYLGVPKQRLTDFLKGRRRLPDAELTLRLLHWLAERRAGRDPAL